MGLRAPLVLGLLVTMLMPPAASPQQAPAGYDALVALFEQWRAFEKPPLRDGAPDYSAAAMAAQHEGLRGFQARLKVIDPSGWPIAQQVDYHLVRAEMNGLDFNHRVLQPWARDPAFYFSVWPEQSDTPAHEGPTHHEVIDLWTYSFPLSAADEARLAGELRTIPPLLRQARQNLTGNARELWLTGIGTMQGQVALLEDLQKRTSGAGKALTGSIADALQSSRDFVAWLEEQAPSKTGPSGIGKENYNWLLRNVYLIPMTWDDEVRLLRRELDRAHSSLHLEEQRNRSLPPLAAAATPEEYARKADQGATKYLSFLAQNQIMPIWPYMDPALRAHLGSFVPIEQRNFFQIVTHYEPMALWTHMYHWWDLARMKEDPNPSPIRRGPLLYNIFAARSEGLATGVEEMMMHAGLYDDNPRSREVVWIMLAQRAARGLGSLYVQANEFTLQQGRDFHVEWTPRGWMRKDLDLLGFEQQLYLRQPGYGSSYITGKYQIERLLTDRGHQLGQLGDKFKLSDFFAEMDAAGVIPVSLIRWQLTGKDDEIRALLAGGD
ncbi:MAG TPA: DUF885 family protein [Thermoanaerobaculia bacterium]|nr:DUF885 family protein [Thermoanaerobaculia bacterium]